MRVASAIVRALVRRYPAPFRERYAREVEQSTRALIHGARGRGLVDGMTTAASAIVDLAKSVIRERRLSRQRGEAPRGGRFGMGAIGQDLRDGVRQIRRNPGFAASVVLTVALAVGGMTAVLAIADPLLFRPLPYPDSDRIMRLTAGSERGPILLYAADFLALRDDPTAFEAIADIDSVLHLGRLRIDDPPDAAVVVGGVTDGFFDVFGMRPARGRVFTREEHEAGARVVLITHALWVREYGARPDVLGRTLTLAGSRPVSFAIVGVLPPDFLFPDFTDDAPVAIAPTDITAVQAANARYMATPFAKLRTDVTPQQAAASAQRAMAAVEESAQQYRQGQRRAVMTPLREALFRNVRQPLMMLLLVTGFVALLAAANLAHLFLARSATRARELATRQALGASRFRLARMLAAEAALLAAVGCAAALLMGALLREFIVAAMPRAAHVYRAVPGTVDARIIGATAVITAGALLIFGLLPAIRTARRDLRGPIAGTSGSRRSLARGGLIFMQTATAVAVLLTALLLASGFLRLATQDLGFRPDGVMTASLLPSAGAPRDQGRIRYLNLEWKRIVEQVTGRPAALADGLPGLHVPIGVARKDQDPRASRIIGYPVSAAFFDVFEIRLVRGRLMTEVESLSGEPVIVVDERAAALSWGTADPIGQEMRDNTGAVRTVIGVVNALQTHVFSTSFQRPTAFVPLPDAPRRLQPVIWRGDASEAAQGALRDAAATLLPQAAASVRPLGLFDRELGPPRFLAALLGALGLLAVALTVVGLYGVVSHGVSHRTREIGIRIALGAETARIARLIVRQAVEPAVMGVALGLAAGLWWVEMLRSMLYGFSPHDWRIFAGAGLLVFGLVALACIMPIRRATRVDPLIALKAE